MSEKNNDNLKIYNELFYNSEDGACRYKDAADNSVFGYYNCLQFYIEYESEKFIRITFTQLADPTKELEMLKQLYTAGHCLSKVYGKPTVYYDRLTFYEEFNLETVNPTLEWCLDKEKEDEFIRSVINDCHLLNDKCINVKPFTGKRLDYYKSESKYILKK